MQKAMELHLPATQESKGKFKRLWRLSIIRLLMMNQASLLNRIVVFHVIVKVTLWPHRNHNLLNIFLTKKVKMSVI